MLPRGDVNVVARNVEGPGEEFSSVRRGAPGGAAYPVRPRKAVAEGIRPGAVAAQECLDSNIFIFENHSFVDFVTANAPAVVVRRLEAVHAVVDISTVGLQDV